MVSPLSLRWLTSSAIVLILLASESHSKPEFIEMMKTRMAALTADVNRQLDEMLSANKPIYTTENKTGLPYNAVTKFNPKGMGRLYNVTNTFISLIQPKRTYPDGLITAQPNKIQTTIEKDWTRLVTHYGVIVGLAITGLLLAAALPCVGLFFCCCRCAGHCGARTQPFDKKHDHCRKVFLSILLIGVATIILFGVVCAFVTNEYMQEGVESIPNKAKTNLEDVKLYLKTTQKEVDNLLVTNFKEFQTTMNEILQKTGTIVTNELSKKTGTVALESLDQIVDTLPIIKEDLEQIRDTSNELRNKATTLQADMDSIRNELTKIVGPCATPDCVSLKTGLEKMRVTVDYDQIPDVQTNIDQISPLLSSDIGNAMNNGKEAFEKIAKKIQMGVKEIIPQVNGKIESAGTNVEEQSKNINEMIKQLVESIDKSAIPLLEEYGKKYVNRYSIYRYYLGLGVSCVLLTVVLCLTFGLLCGICGKRPDGYGDDCCNKGSGARFLMMAVWVIFLLTSVLMIIITVHMLVGVVVNRIICEPLKNPSDSQLLNLISDYVDLKEKLYPDNTRASISLSGIITRCHANESLYQVLKLEYRMPLDASTYVNVNEINATMSDMLKGVELTDSIDILPLDTTTKLNELKDTNLHDIKIEECMNLSHKLTDLDLEKYAGELRKTAQTMPEAIKNPLLIQAKKISDLQEKTVKPMIILIGKLNSTAHKFTEDIKFNQSSMTDAIQKLMDDVEGIQKFLREEGPSCMKNLTAKFQMEFIDRITKFVTYLTTSANETVGQCSPVSNAYNATIVAGCNSILDPFNGFWVSVGWCLILFIPTIILCVKLGALYQKSDPYPGPLVESEYLYDAYADRDNMPLAHGHDKKHNAHTRHQPNAFVESYDGPASAGMYSGRERVADAHQGSSQHDSRYSDLAPNSANLWQRHDRVASSKPESQNKVYNIPLDSQNWDNFPNGGPPRYQPPPGAPPLSTEYERPPPYYYPGPGDRN